MEQNQKQQKWIRILVWAGVLVVTIFLFAMFEDVFSLTEPKEIFGALSDACFVPGVLFAGVGVFTWISSKGGYDAFGYAFSNFSLHNLFPTKQPKKYATLYEYKKEKDEKGRQWLPQALLAGVAAILLGTIFLVLYLI